MNESPSNDTDNAKLPAAAVEGATGGKGPSFWPEISVKQFLDFLATAYRLDEALENSSSDSFKKSSTINWNQLADSAFISVLLQSANDERVQIQKHGCEKDHESQLEEADGFGSKTNGASKSSYGSQSLDQSGPEKAEDGKPVSKQGSKKHKRGRSGSIGNINGRSDKSKLEKRRSSFAKKESIDSKSKSRCEVNIAEKQIKKKLSDVLQEGILDSVLPYVIPRQNNLGQKKPSSVNEKKMCHEKSPATLSSQGKDVAVYHSKKHNFLLTSENSRESTKDIEVEIHVCDEVKNMKKDFRCSQKLLVSKMGYFAEVTTGQNLEDMDISVHCDITIFEWLMRWVKKDPARPEMFPQLDAANVIPVLVSAAFLQMDPLLNDCLAFCQEHMNDILRLATNLSCLNDSIITRLASQFSNTEIEEMRDKRDKLRSRMFCKLIAFLSELEADPKRGHYSSLAYMFECGHCRRLLPRTLGAAVPCRPADNRVDSLGRVLGVHVRSAGWSVSDWVRRARAELGCWRAVYWRLWAHAHWLLCSVCRAHYPVAQSDWCRYHPDPPQFFIMEQHRTMSFPIGRYPCCGERAYRFEVLQISNGCTYRSHVPIVDSNVSVSIQQIFQAYRPTIAVEPPHTVFQERLTRLVRSNRDGSNNVEDNRDCVPSTSLWSGMEKASSSHKTALISRIWEKPKETKPKLNWAEKSGGGGGGGVGGQPLYQEVSGSSENATSSPEETERDSSPSLGEDNSEDSLLCSSPVHKATKKSSATFVYSPNQPNRWLARYSTRYNQDSLRDYEEWSLGTAVALLSRRHGGDAHRRAAGCGRGKWGPHVTPVGGTYSRLEAQWREGHLQLCQSRAPAPPLPTARGRSVASSRARPRSNMR